MEEKKIHHANIVVGETDCRDFVFDILKNDLGFETKGNPDFLMMESESFGIDDARGLEKWAAGKPLLSDTKVSFITALSLTHEAQNALLKVLEEPPLGTYIFIGIQNAGGLLPTFLSRVRILTSAGESKIENKNGKFARAGLKEKFAIIASLSKKENKNEMKELIKSLEKEAYKENRNSLNHILTAKIFAGSRGSSPKMLLEWLACVL